MHVSKNWLVLVAAILMAACGSGATASSQPAATSVSSPATPSTAPTSAAPSKAVVDPWIVVALGDSIPYNLEDDCPGCRGFVDQYQLDFQKASGHPVTPRNLSKHTGLRLQGLLDDLANPSTQASVAQGDAIIVGIGFNDVPFNVDDDPCDGATQWDTREQAIAGAKQITAACMKKWTDKMRPKFEEMYSQIAALRAGKPTILLTIDRYNDNPGWCENRTCAWNGPTTPKEVVAATKLAVDAWDEMMCEAAVKNGFTCVDIYHSFNGPDGLQAAGDLLAADYTHPSQAGNDRIAELLAAEGYDPVWP
jgi:lysophospholipase L1-like esterase